MKKVWNIIKTVLSWLLIIFTLCVVLFTVVSLKTVDARQRNILGYKMMIVQSDSMSATHFAAGDLIFVKEVDPATLQAGDVISFVSRNSHNPGETVTHMIRSLTVDENGWAGFITYGTTTDTDDEAIVRYSDVLGKYVGRIENMGVFFAFLRTPKGYIAFILIPLLIMIFFSLFNCIRMFSGAQKQVEEEHKAAVEEERRKNDQMRQELDELRALIMTHIASQPQLPPQAAPAPEETRIPRQEVAAPAQPPQMGEEPAKQEPVALEMKAEAAKPASGKDVPTPAKPQEADKPPKPEAPAPAKKQEAPKLPKKDAAAPAKKQESAPKESTAAEPKKPGRFASSPDQKNAGVLTERKPNRQRKRPEGYDELDLENIMAEYRPRPQKPL